MGWAFTFQPNQWVYFWLLNATTSLLSLHFMSFPDRQCLMLLLREGDTYVCKRTWGRGKEKPWQDSLEERAQLCHQRWMSIEKRFSGQGKKHMQNQRKWQLVINNNYFSITKPNSTDTWSKYWSMVINPLVTPKKNLPEKSRKKLPENILYSY